MKCKMIKLGDLKISSQNYYYYYYNNPRMNGKKIHVKYNNWAKVEWMVEDFFIY